jgi:hypothetical protein
MNQLHRNLVIGLGIGLVFLLVSPMLGGMMGWAVPATRVGCVASAW